MGKRSKYSLITGVLYQFTNTLMGLILPYLFITSFGSETNGLLSSVTQLFVYLDLLEAGVGTATLQALYKPLTQDDKKEISCILSATNSYYKRTGIIYGILVIALSFTYPFFVDSEISYPTIVVIILLQGIGAVWSYLFSAKYNVLLKAEGRLYITNTILLISTVLRNAGKIIAIYLGYGIIAVQFINLVIIWVQSLIIVFYAKRKYAWLNFKEKPDFNAISQKNSVLVQQIAWLVFNHSDVLVLTVVSRNLALVSVYSMYTLVFEAIQNLIETAKNSFQFKLGWKSQKSHAEFQAYFRKYENYYLASTFALFTMAGILVTPFMRLYTASASDADYLMKGLPYLFLIMKLLYMLRGLGKQVIEAVGDFKKTQYVAITETIINLLVSFILVFFYGIYGVLIGTIVALAFSGVAYLRHCNKRILKDSNLVEMLEIMLYFVMAVTLTVALSSLTGKMCTYLTLIMYAIPVCLIIVIAFVIVALLFNSMVTRRILHENEEDK